MGKLNKSLEVGGTQTIITKQGRKITFKRVSMSGFPQWKILSNVKA